MHQQIGQVNKFANRTAAVQRAVVDGCNACAVISTVFQTLERFDQDGRCFVVAQNPDNSAHGYFPSARLAFFDLSISKSLRAMPGLLTC